jgi:hypothetical protein
MIITETNTHYCPEERKLHGNGSKYAWNIDNTIIQTSYRDKVLSAGNLESSVENTLHRSSTPSYNTHIESLWKDGILYRNDHGRGKSVEYSLSENARK